MQILDEAGINLDKYFRVIGIADTQVLVEESMQPIPLSLSGLVLYCRLHKEKESRRARNSKGALIFNGAHNAGNDAIANLQALVCVLFDSVLDEGYVPDTGDVYKDVVFADEDRYERWMCGSMKPNLAIMCFDYEGVGGRTSEYGFAWYTTSALASIRPTPELKESWRFLQARHFLVDQFKDHPGSRFTDGDPRGFWPEFGKTTIYNPSDGLKPFNELFSSIGTALGGVVDRISSSKRNAGASLEKVNQVLMSKI